MKRNGSSLTTGIVRMSIIRECGVVAAYPVFLVNFAGLAQADTI